ncbi:prohibitin [Strigomonas culicis]|uniref:Prohibitin n=1 Tax=Strigomonas culicis TaxID=28005 RepID=S9UYJ9_9TRYP|nr:prohibitin [Strigomonas culicis]EPY25054.1 prohibitin [Strigomonas culicis]EPY35932.1 prohibitin [Strigomonas culicis]|eukprot:EPY24932.1 prohibitin [Strigomonas culicis]
MSKAPPAPDFSRIAAEVRKKLNQSFGAGSILGMASLASVSLVGAYGLYHSVYFVRGGFRAVKFNCITGLHERTYGEGANFAIPFLETPVIFDIRNRPIEVPTSSGSRDLQTVNMAVRVLFQPSTEDLHHIYRNIGVNYAETVLPSLINEIIRAVIAQFNAADLLIKRPEVSHQIAVMLAERAKRFKIEITDVSITQMSFGKEYTNAVEAKQVAQQMAERAKFRVDQARLEKEAAILLARGEAESATLVGNAIKSNPSFLELRGLEAARKIAKVLREKGQGRYFLDSESLYLNLKSGQPSR